MQRHEHAFRVYKPSGKPPAAASKPPKPTAKETAPAPASSTWIDHSSFVSGEGRKDIRAQAARASAAARRATLAKKQARRNQQPGSQLITFAASNGDFTSPADFKRKVNRAVATVGSNPDKTEHAFFERLLNIITPFLEQRPMSLEHQGELSLAHSTIKSMMWDGMTRSTTLFQVAIFVAGTHSNTCGLPRSAFVHMGPGLVALRGESMKAIEQKITSSQTGMESTAPLAIALLAGWERLYGDQDSYAVHMNAWKALPLPSKSLEEHSVTTMTDLTLEMYRHGLNETAQPQNDANSLDPLASLPVGFQCVVKKRPEARSLLSIVAQLARHDRNASGEVERLRKIGLVNMSWSQTHSLGYAPKPDHEQDIDPLELNVLYHIRAANIPICGIMLEAVMQAHNVDWPFDLHGALWIHTSSCVHLKTEALMGTKYQDIGLWARYSLCALAPDPPQHPYLLQLLQRRGLTTWKKLKGMLKRHLYHESFEERFSKLFEQIMNIEDKPGNSYDADVDHKQIG